MAMAPHTTITPELRKALDGVIPFVIGTCGADGKPNITFMSQLFYVDDQHVALSYQFMNKTWRNLLHNPLCTAMLTCPESTKLWRLRLQFVEEKQDGAIFEEMEMQLMALATPQHISFSLHSALICKILAIEEVFDPFKSA